MEKEIQIALKEAMKAKDKVALAALRSVKAQILLIKTSGTNNGEVTDAEIVKSIQKMVKQRKESADIYTQQNRPELAENELAESKVLEKYLPAAMTETEITEHIAAIIIKIGASSMADMGKVMGIVTKELAGKADGKVISKIVREKLA
ncbi:MAG: GatB/YqeY domain-containing protein [Bacteroidales bacterium]